MAEPLRVPPYGLALPSIRQMEHPVQQKKVHFHNTLFRCFMTA